MPSYKSSCQNSCNSINHLKYIYRLILILYILLTFALSYIPQWVLRLFFKKYIDDDVLWLGRFGKYIKQRPSGELVWFHAASIGELNSIMMLLDILHKKKPKLNILITTMTITSAKLFYDSQLMKNNNNNKNYGIIIHQYVPIDSVIIIKKFLDYWKPNLSIFVDSEFWPNLLRLTKKQCPLILLNARISPTSIMLKYFPNLAFWLIDFFDVIIPTGKHDASRIINLNKSLKNKICELGNIKYLVNKINVSEVIPNYRLDIKKNNFYKNIKNKVVFVCASTHGNGEEEALLKVHKSLLKKIPNLLTIIVPRNIERGRGEISKIACGLNLKYVTYTENLNKINEVSLCIVDTFGELLFFYSIADIVFVGGSLIKHGGQNILEPMRFGNVVVVGPYYYNFQEIVDDAQRCDAINVISNDTELENKIYELINNKNLNTKFRKASLKFSASYTYNVDGFINIIEIYIK